MPECRHNFDCIDEGAYECLNCGVWKVQCGPLLYTIDEDGNLTDWQGKPVSEAEAHRVADQCEARRARGESNG